MVALFLLPWAGCHREPINRVLVIDHRGAHAVQHSHEDFEEAYYRVSADGLVDVVLMKKIVPADRRGRDITQYVHVRAFWKPSPGRTNAEDTMINAQVSYVIVNGLSGIAYDGGGFFHYREDSRRGQVQGTLTCGDLQPLRQVGEGLDVFDKASISGRFAATLDERRTTRLINELTRLLGVMPRFDATRPSPDY